jgi:hypothetical protein
LKSYMKHMKKFILILLFATPVFAEDPQPANLEDIPEPPVLSDPVESGEAIEPEVTIIRKEEAIIEEYRVNGNLYMVKVTPAVGKPYYLLDRDGDGQMESRVNDIYNDIPVPQWVLFSW